MCHINKSRDNFLFFRFFIECSCFNLLNLRISNPMTHWSENNVHTMYKLSVILHSPRWISSGKVSSTVNDQRIKSSVFREEKCLATVAWPKELLIWNKTNINHATNLSNPTNMTEKVFFRRYFFGGLFHIIFIWKLWFQWNIHWIIQK